MNIRQILILVAINVFVAFFFVGCQSLESMPSSNLKTIKILPLGDSITEGNADYNSYRRPLWHTLKAADFDVDFVGTQRKNLWFGPPDSDFDLDHEGHWGWDSSEILHELPGWLEKIQAPDIVLIHLGTNDVGKRQSFDNILENFSKIISLLRHKNPKVSIILAQLIPARYIESELKNFNARLSELMELSSAESKIILVDMNTGFDLENFTWDGLHPNEAGEKWIAERWRKALLPILKSLKTNS